MYRGGGDRMQNVAVCCKFHVMGHLQEHCALGKVKRK
jgi:hypothetical protein